MPHRDTLPLLLVGAILSLYFPKALALLPLARRPLLRAPRALFSTGTSTTMADNNEFDDDFLADFDVDAAVQARHSDANKRQKTDDAAGRAPFAENSPFTIGYTTNPTNELASASGPNVPSLQQQENQASASFTTTSPSDVTEEALENTLQQYFGHATFRSGQVEVLQAILSGRDAAVFWATGSGKSMCYQIPALFTGKTSLVVSPLISLMQDQVNKLNGLSAEPLATFLGSAQVNPSEEMAALAGKYRLVYVTPEKLLSGGFLNDVSRMNLACIAIDESHCVSEWGHDFRSDYRQLHQIRSHPSLSNVPIVALTATAVPRVQNDILKSLNLRNPLIALQSFDRTNLKIEIHKRRSSRCDGTVIVENGYREYHCLCSYSCICRRDCHVFER